MTKEEMKEQIKEYNQKQQDKGEFSHKTFIIIFNIGVCYLSKIPPYMSVASVRSLLSPYGVERIYLSLEGLSIADISII